MDNKFNENESAVKNGGGSNSKSSHHSGGSHHSSNKGSRHHHSSHHHSSRKKHKKLKANLKVILLASALLAALALVLVIAFKPAEPYEPSDPDQPVVETGSDILSAELINAEGRIINDAVKEYLAVDLMSAHNSNVAVSDFSNGQSRLDAQVPVELKLSTKDSSAKAYKRELADNSVFNDAKVSYIEGTTGVYTFEHLYANTEYFYRVTVYTSSGTDSESGSFKTADCPRILSIDGISNVRDIGNWQTDSGKRIKQGLLIRGTEMDGAVENGYHLTNEGLSDMLDVFGIKTDIDLRAKTPLSKDTLGPRVEHKYYDMVMYAEIFSDTGKQKVKEVFTDLSDKNKYPIYLHCTYGKDRTGVVCYLLEALLGVSRGDCLKDYGLSNMKAVYMAVVEEGLKAYEGNTLMEQTEAYLLSCGVNEYQIQSIRDIFLGE